MCIYDTGGEDTISAVNNQEPVIINLNPADLGNVQDNIKNILGENFNTSGGYISTIPSLIGSGFTISGNLTQIENAVGGNNNDYIFENDNSNNIDGGDGTDLVTFLGDHSNYRIRIEINNTTQNIELAQLNHKTTGETDTLTNVEYIKFNNSTDISIQNIKSALQGNGLNTNDWFDLSNVSINDLNSSVLKF